MLRPNLPANFPQKIYIYLLGVGSTLPAVDIQGSTTLQQCIQKLGKTLKVQLVESFTKSFCLIACFWGVLNYIMPGKSASKRLIGSVYDGLAASLYQAYPPNRRLLPTGKAPEVVAVSRAVAASTLPPRPEGRLRGGSQAVGQ